jgi:hypothetical protein
MNQLKTINSIITKASLKDQQFNKWVQGMKGSVNKNIWFIQAGLNVITSMNDEINNDMERFIFEVSDSIGWYKSSDFFDLKNERDIFMNSIFNNIKKLSEDFQENKKFLYDFDNCVNKYSENIIKEYNSTKGLFGSINPVLIVRLPILLKDFYGIIENLRIAVTAMLVHKYIAGNYSTYETQRLMKWNFETHGLVYEEGDRVLTEGITDRMSLMMLIAQISDLKL